MAKVIDVEITGIEEIQAEIRKMSTNADKYVAKALKKGAEIYKTEISRRAPYNSKGVGGYKGSGHLRDHINMSGVSKNKLGQSELFVGVEKGDNSNWFYGKFFEWGTSKMSARPFVQPSFNAKKDEVYKVIIDSLKGDLNL